MAKYISDRNVVQIGAETVAGTYEAPTAVLPVEKGTGVWAPNMDTDVSDPVSASHGSKETTIISDFATVDISSKMKLPSDHTLIASALLACGVSSSVITGGVAYAYDSANAGTASLLQTTERKTTAVYGARGDFSLMCEVGKSAEVSFDFKSQLKEVVQLGTAVTIDNVLPAVPGFETVFMTKDCAVYLVNGNAAHFKKVELKLGANIVVPKDTCAGECYTQDVKPELQVTMAVTSDNEDAFLDLKSGTQFNFVIPLFDNNGVKKWEIVAPKCVVIDQKTPVNEGRLDVDRTLECRKTLGDDNWELRAFV